MTKDELRDLFEKAKAAREAYFDAGVTRKTFEDDLRWRVLCKETAEAELAYEKAIKQYEAEQVSV